MGRLNRIKVSKRPPVKQILRKKPKDLLKLKKLGLAFLITALAVVVYIKIQPHTFQAKQAQQLENKTLQLKNTLKQLEQQKNQDSQTQKKLQDTQQQLQDTQKQLESKRNSATAYAAELPVTQAQSAPQTASVTACGSDPLMAKIYSLESGCRTGAYNYLGCRGLGQACPGSKLPCSDSDWACQDSWFRNYAVARYGSIYNAYIFRINHDWW